MDQTIKIEKATINGLRTEVHVQEQIVNGTTERVTTHLEEVVQYAVKKRVVEKVMPVVVERVTEEYNGNQIDRMVERVDDNSLKMTVPVSCDVKPVKKFAFVNPFKSGLKVNLQPVQPNTIISYVLIAVLALEAGWVVWQMFIR